LALLPGTVGPEEGKGLALADDASRPEKAATNKVFEIRRSTGRLKSAWYARDFADWRKKSNGMQFCEALEANHPEVQR